MGNYNSIIKEFKKTKKNIDDLTDKEVEKLFDKLIRNEIKSMKYYGGRCNG